MIFLRIDLSWISPLRTSDAALSLYVRSLTLALCQIDLPARFAVDFSSYRLIQASWLCGENRLIHSIHHNDRQCTMLELYYVITD